MSVCDLLSINLPQLRTAAGSEAVVAAALRLLAQLLLLLLCSRLLGRAGRLDATTVKQARPPTREAGQQTGFVSPAPGRSWGSGEAPGEAGAGLHPLAHVGDVGDGAVPLGDGVGASLFRGEAVLVKSDPYDRDSGQSTCRDIS